LRRVRGLLAPAHEALTRLPATERGDTAFGYTQRQLLFHEGDTLVMLGDHLGAEKAFTWSLDLYAPDEILDRSLISFGLARCRLAAGSPRPAVQVPAAVSPVCQARNASVSADRRTDLLTARAPWPTCDSRRSRIGRSGSRAEVACWSAAHILRACIGSTLLS